MFAPRFVIQRLVLSLLGALVATSLPAQRLEDFEKRVTEFTLPNGLHFIVLERHEAPVVAFNAFVNVGAVDDPGGKSSMAHMFEHMIGKGTRTVGSKNPVEEQKALDEVERIYDRLEEERRRPKPDKDRVAALEKQLQAAIEKANSYVESNAFVRVIEENGGTNFNAGTAQDFTMYHYSLPSNRLELWFLLQSDWFKRPVFREFYKERDVVREERRMRIESSPQGKLQELLAGTAFLVHPYRNLVGWASEIENLRAKDAERFFRTYYVPGNITIAIVGDVDPAEVRRLAEKYYNSLEPGPLPPGVVAVEPPQEGEKRATLESPAQPFLAIAFKRPSQTHKDDVVFDVLASLLSSGRTGLLYRELVRDGKMAIAAFAGANFPGGKYPTLFIIFTVPAPGHSVEENEKAVYAILERLAREKVDEASLQRVKTKIRASHIRQLDSNEGLAFQLAFYHVAYGSWKTMFTGLDEIDKVTAEDVQRVVKTYFTQRNRTVAYTVPVPKANVSGGGAQ